VAWSARVGRFDDFERSIDILTVDTIDKYTSFLPYSFF